MEQQLSGIVSALVAAQARYNGAVGDRIAREALVQSAAEAESAAFVELNKARAAFEAYLRNAR